MRITRALFVLVAAAALSGHIAFGAQQAAA